MVFDWLTYKHWFPWQLFLGFVGTGDCCMGAFAEATNMWEGAFGESTLFAVETPACIVEKAS